MDERVEQSMAGAAAALDYDAELMLRVKDGDGAPFDSEHSFRLKVR